MRRTTIILLVFVLLLGASRCGGGGQATVDANDVDARYQPDGDVAANSDVVSIDTAPGGHASGAFLRDESIRSRSAIESC